MVLIEKTTTTSNLAQTNHGLRKNLKILDNELQFLHYIKIIYFWFDDYDFFINLGDQKLNRDPKVRTIAKIYL